MSVLQNFPGHFWLDHTEPLTLNTIGAVIMILGGHVLSVGLFVQKMG